MATTTGSFVYTDPTSITPGQKPWAKVDISDSSYRRVPHTKTVSDIRDVLGLHSQRGAFGTDIDVAGFAIYNAPAAEKTFTDDTAVRTGYYAEVEALLRSKLEPTGGPIKKVVIFDHTIRRRDPNSPRQPVQNVHVDQTPGAAEARVRRHVPDPAEAEALLSKRYQLINVWRPIGHPASDFPLAVVDYRTTAPEDLVPVNLLYPLRNRADGTDDDRGKEALADPSTIGSTEGYEVKGETFAVLPSDRHRLYYLKDMTPDEAMFLKCFDSWGETRPGGKKGVSSYTPHTAFVDPDTPKDAPGRQSIEVRCLVFYE